MFSTPLLLLCIYLIFSSLQNSYHTTHQLSRPTPFLLPSPATCTISSSLPLFPSHPRMASSVARMPGDDWRGPGRLSVGVFGVHPHLNTVLPWKRSDVPAPAGTATNEATDRKNGSKNSSSPSPSSASDREKDGVGPRKATDAASASDSDDARSTASAEWKQRQSQILDRWAARQARGMVTTIERQAHQVELSELTTTVQPVSVRAASFLRETSPKRGNSSASNADPSCSVRGPCKCASAGDRRIDVPKNVRASSLIQMWRELEAEAGLVSTPRTTSGGSDHFGANCAVPFSAEEHSENSDEGETSGGWESDSTMASCSTIEPAHSPLYQSSEKGRVGSIVRMLSAVCSKPKSPTLATSANENAAPAEERLRPWNVMGTSSSTCSTPRLRERREMEQLIARMEQERRREIDALSEYQHVSQFCYRGRLQSMLRLRSLRRQLAVPDHLRARMTTTALGQAHKQKLPSFSFLRHRFNHEEPSNAHIEMSTSFESSVYVHSADESHLEGTSAGDSESTPPEANSPRSRSDGMQEGNNSPDGSWDERNMWSNNMSWQGTADSSPSNVWNPQVLPETRNQPSCNNLNVAGSSSTWICESPDSWRGWNASRRTGYPDLLASFSDNVEIRELLERKRVSTSLASEFCDKMNQLMSTLLQRRSQLCFDENIEDNYEERPYWSQSYQIQNSEQAAFESSSLVPLPNYNIVHHPETWQHNSSSNVHETKMMQDLRSGVTQIHNEISELRRLIQSCMEWQSKFQLSIKQEVSEAIRHSGCSVVPPRAQSMSISSNSMLGTGRKGNCCVCHEKQVDSLLYKCGHMCACFNCAYKLQLSSGKCPICQSRILDVVRAHPNS